MVFGQIKIFQIITPPYGRVKDVNFRRCTSADLCGGGINGP